MIEHLALVEVFLRQSITGDARLQKPIQIAEYVRDAPTICADLGKLTGVAITCDPFIKDDLIVLVVKHRPAVEVMAKVASTFDWQWLAQGNGGYRLAPTDRFVHRAETGRAEILLAEGRRRQKAARELMASIEHQDAKAIEAQFKEAQGRLQKESTQPDLLEKDQKEVSSLFQRMFPVTEVALAAFADLDAESLVRLADRRLVVSSQPGPLELAIGDGALAVWERVLKRTADVKASGENGGLTDPSFGAMPTFATQTDVELNNWDGAVVVGHDGEAKGQTLMEVALPSPTPAPLGPLAKELERELERPMEASFEVIPSTSAQTPEDPVSFFATFMSLTASRLNADVVSDAYDGYSEWIQNWTTPGRLESARRAGFRPQLADGWLMNRNEFWPRWREEQMPRDLYRQITSASLTQTIDECAKVYSQLTVPQLHSPFVFIRSEDYWFYRAWNAMAPPIRQAIRAGKSIPLTEIPANTLEYLYEAGEKPVDDKSFLFSFSWGGNGPFTEPEFVDYDRLSSMLSPVATAGTNPEEIQEAMSQRYNDFAFLYPGRLDSSARVWAQSVSIPSVYSEEFGTVYAPGDLITNPLNPTPELATTKPLRLATSTAIRFHFVLKKGVEVREDLSETTLGKAVSADRSTWPKDLLDRIRKRQLLQAQLSAFTSPPPPPIR